MEKRITAATREGVNTAIQTLEVERVCKHSTRYVPESSPAEVLLRDGGSKVVDEITSVVYISKEVLELLGNPKKIDLRITAVE